MNFPSDLACHPKPAPCRTTVRNRKSMKKSEKQGFFKLFLPEEKGLRHIKLL
jgi:hypothetical protein